MIRIISTIRQVSLGAAAVSLLFVASALVFATQAEAQAGCVGCMYTGTPEPGVGQPGGGFDCVDQPEGMTSCSTGRQRTFGELVRVV